MVQATACPSAPVIRQLLLGQSADEDSASLEEHLLHCDKCLRTVQTLPADDTFISPFQQGPPLVSQAPPSRLVEKLRQRLQELSPASRGADTASAEDYFAPHLVAEPTSAENVSLGPPKEPDEIGRLGGYRILQELGRGGMGVVYRAEDPKLKRHVAIKVMRPRTAADDSARRRFLREAQAMAAVHHDHVVAIYQVDEDNGVPFLAMEFLHGTPLDKWLKEGSKPNLSQILRMGREIAEGLAAAHDRGLIHRDIKPGNIWLDSDHKDRVKILDFGLARVGTEDVHLTADGAVVGTPAYMSPEQAAGEKVDARSDLFSLGCVLYRLCTGAMPFDGGTTMALLTSLAVARPKPVRDLSADVPAPLSDLVMRLLAKNPADRPASAQEVVEALQTIESASVDDRTAAYIRPAGKNPAAHPVSGGKKRRPLLLTAVAAAFFAAVIAGAIVVIIRDKNGNKTAELILPDGGTVNVGQNENAVTAAKAALSPPDDAWVEKVQSLPPEKQIKLIVDELKRLNPRFDGVVAPTIRDGVVTELKFDTDNITDVAPVRALKSLTSLRCAGSTPNVGRLSDLSPLKDLRLTWLDCGYSAVYDLSPLKQMKLNELRCYGSRIADLSPLKDMELTQAILGDSEISDLTPLKKSKLTVLNVAYTHVYDLSPLKGMPLNDLLCHNTEVSDLSPLKDMRLIYLHCFNTKVSDLSPLKGMPLTTLRFAFTNVADLGPLKGMSLTNLSCDHTKVTALSVIKDMPLKVLYCDFKPERDANLLRSIKTLETINDQPAAEFWKEVNAKPTDKKR